MSTTNASIPIPPTMGTDGIHYATPLFPTSSRTTHLHLLRALLQMIQGFPTSIFHWDPKTHSFFLACDRTYLPHLSITALHNLISPFIYSSNCLKIVELIVARLGSCGVVPTLRAFASCASLWLQRLRGVALKEEEKVCGSRDGLAPTLLELSISLSRLMDVVDASIFSGAEYLLQIVNGAIPASCFESNSGVTAAEIAVDILDYLYKKLGEVCLVQHGKEESYLMVLYLFVGSILPCIESLDSWLFEGILDDPFEEMFFYANKAITVDESEFWEKSYQLRQVRFQKLNTTRSMALASNNKGVSERDSTSMPISTKAKEVNHRELQLCSMFLKDIAMSVVSAGKSLQLIRHVAVSSLAVPGKGAYSENDGFGSFNDFGRPQEHIAGLTLPEIFCLSVAGLIGHGDHIYRNFVQDELFRGETTHSLVPDMFKVKVKDENGQDLPPLRSSEKFWHKLFTDTLAQRKLASNEEGIDLSGTEREYQSADSMHEFISPRSFFPENPVITVCQTMLAEDRQSWKMLNLSRNFHLPPLNDEVLRDAVFGRDHVVSSALKGTNYSFGFQFGKSEHLRLHDDIKMLEVLFPFPTLLPLHQDNVRMSELLPSQKNSTLTSRVLGWIQSIEPRMTPLPVIIIHECLTIYIKKQVDYIGRVILSKLMNDWRLMDELAVLRAIYLLGSGDLLQHFFTVIFNKLDKGETWDDEFELNTILQESIRNSADALLLRAPDLLVVSTNKHHGHDDDELPGTPTLAATHWRSHPPNNGIDRLESLKFTYKVPWPLELIANTDAVKKYNKVMGFLVKVKRAKFVLDKTRRWMWKAGGNVTNSLKRQWLVEQKLLHFVDAFHQYVMDRVYHSAWRELCEGMAAAGSLDEVIEVHEAYLLSIQRQCFVVSDKFWAMIGSRINNILGLALEFYSIQQTLSSGAGSAMKARCEMEVDRIEKQFDERIAFLLRVLSSKLNVGHFPHLADLVTRINYNCFYMSDT